jgi:sarcosine oxidase delta subunit
MDVTLTMDQVDKPAPECPMCAQRTQQEFKPVALGGSNYARARKVAEDIAEKDYHVADMSEIKRQGDQRKVRYKDQSATSSSSWGIAQETLASAISAGRQSRLQHGSGLDILQANLKSGAEPDLIEISKRRSMKIW